MKRDCLESLTRTLILLLREQHEHLKAHLERSADISWASLL